MPHPILNSTSIYYAQEIAKSILNGEPIFLDSETLEGYLPYDHQQNALYNHYEFVEAIHEYIDLYMEEINPLVQVEVTYDGEDEYDNPTSYKYKFFSHSNFVPDWIQKAESLFGDKVWTITNFTTLG